jgi:YCII-related domain
MSNFLFAYRGGSMAETDEERQAVMAAWGAWFGELGDAIVDPGNPFAGSASVNGAGAVGNGAGSALSGYSVLKADSLDRATELAKGCPVLSRGGSVDVYETIEVM